MTHFEITERTGYSTAWVFLAVLLVAGIVAWWLISAFATLIIAGVGLAVSVFFRLRGKKKVGAKLELNDKGITFYDAEQIRCIAFSEIKHIKYSKLPGMEECFTIVTTVGNKRTLNPEDYENGDVLKEKLMQRFSAYNCRILT